MRWIVILLVLSVTGCATQGAMDAWGLKIAFGTSLADPRISEKLATVDSDGVQVGADKFAASEQFMGMLEATLPDIVEAAVKAALVSAGIGAAGDLIGGFGNGVPEGVPEIMEEVVPE